MRRPVRFGLAAAVLAAILAAAALLAARGAHPWLRHRLLDAVAEGDATAARVWLALGGSPNEPLPSDGLRRAPLHWACASRPPGSARRIVRMLLAAGARVEARTSSGATPLQWCASYGRSDAVAALLDAGAEIDAREVGGRTALMAAARLGRAGVVRLLLERGADRHLRDAEGRTALDLAADERRTELAALLGP